MIVSIKGKRVFIGHKITVADRNNIIVDDLLDNNESVSDFLDKHKIHIKENITRFTDVEVLKG